MANNLYNEFGPTPVGGQDIMSAINTLKQSVSDPNAMIQQLLNSGQVSQAQYNSAVQQAQAIQAMLNQNRR